MVVDRIISITDNLIMAATTLSETSHLRNQNDDKTLLDTVEKLRLKISTLERENQILKEGEETIDYISVLRCI